MWDSVDLVWILETSRLTIGDPCRKMNKLTPPEPRFKTSFKSFEPGFGSSTIAPVLALELAWGKRPMTVQSPRNTCTRD